MASSYTTRLVKLIKGGKPAPNQPQHVILRGNNRQVIFVADDNYRFFLEYLEEAARHYQADIHAYVLIPNHAHHV